MNRKIDNVEFFIYQPTISKSFLGLCATIDIVRCRYEGNPGHTCNYYPRPTKKRLQTLLKAVLNSKQFHLIAAELEDSNLRLEFDRLNCFRKNPKQNDLLSKNPHLIPVEHLSDGDLLVLDADGFGPYILTIDGRLQEVNHHYQREHFQPVAIQRTLRKDDNA